MRKMSGLYPLLLNGFAALFVSAHAQITFLKFYGGAGGDCGNAVRQTSDGGYVTAGWTESFGAGRSDVYLFRTDSQGNVLWTKTYGDTLSQSASDLLETSDGGFAIVGATQTLTRNNDIWLLRTNASGDTLWTKTFGTDALDEPSSIVPAHDGGYVIAGRTGEGNGQRVYLVKVSPDGEPVWTKLFGGNQSSCYAIRQTPDNGYVLVGYLLDSGYPYRTYVYLIKTDVAGNELWARTYGDRGNYEFGYSLACAENGGYVIAGAAERLGAGGYTYYLIKTDSNGDTVWTRCNNYIGYAYSVCLANDGIGYVAAGARGEPGGNADIWLQKTDTSGTTLWTRTYLPAGSYDYGNAIQPTNDGGYAVTGLENSVGYLQAFLLKTASDGTIGIAEPTSQSQPLQKTRLVTTAITADRVRVEYQVTEPGRVRIGLYNRVGAPVAELADGIKKPGNYSVEFNTARLPVGTYFCRLQGGVLTETAKLVVVK